MAQPKPSSIRVGPDPRDQQEEREARIAEMLERIQAIEIELPITWNRPSSTNEKRTAFGQRASHPTSSAAKNLEPELKQAARNASG